MHNLKTNSLGNILTPLAMLVPIAAFLLGLLFGFSGNACTHFGVLRLFSQFFCQFFLQLKSFSKTLSAHIILVLDATFVPNLMFLGLLNSETSFAEKQLLPHTSSTQLISPSVNPSAPH